MPDAPGLELILAGINAEHPGAVLDTSYDREQAALIVNPACILEVLTWLRDTEGQQYTFLLSVHGADYLPAEPRFAVHYELLNRERYERLRVKALLADPAAAPSGANGAKRRPDPIPSYPRPSEPTSTATPKQNKPKNASPRWQRPPPNRRKLAARGMGGPHSEAPSRRRLWTPLRPPTTKACPTSPPA